MRRPSPLGVGLPLLGLLLGLEPRMFVIDLLKMRIAVHKGGVVQ